MSPDSPVRVLNFSGPRLDPFLVRGLDAELTAMGMDFPRAVVVDCSDVLKVTPQGLAALLELGGRLNGVWKVALAALPRSFVLAAVEVGLAERFAIYATVEAAQRALADGGG